MLTSISCQAVVTCGGSTKSHFIYFRKNSGGKDSSREVGTVEFDSFLKLILSLKIRNLDIPLMAFRPFTQKHVFTKLVAPKERDKGSIQSFECYGQNLYIGTKNASVQHLIFPRSSDGDQHPGQWSVREGRTRKLGSTSSVAQLRAVPLFNHLLVLCDRSIAALNMFSLEPIPALKKIQHVSLFEVWNLLLPDQTPHVQMVTSSSRRKVIQIHVIGVDSWEVKKEILVLQDPVALAVDGSSMCYATIDKYLLCDIHTGSSEELFPNSHSRQQAIVLSVGQGEFLLNGPEYLGKSSQSANIATDVNQLISASQIKIARGYLLWEDINSPSLSLRHVCDEDRDMPASSPSVAPGGAGSRHVFPLHNNPAAPIPVHLQHGGSSAEADCEPSRGQGSALCIR